MEGSLSGKTTGFIQEIESKQSSQMGGVEGGIPRMPVVLEFTQNHLKQMASYPTLGQALSVHELIMV